MRPFRDVRCSTARAGEGSSENEKAEDSNQRTPCMAKFTQRASRSAETDKTARGEEPALLEDPATACIVAPRNGAPMEEGAEGVLVISTSHAEDEQAAEHSGRSGTKAASHAEEEEASEHSRNSKSHSPEAASHAEDEEAAEHSGRSGASSSEADEAAGCVEGASRAVNKELAKKKLKRLRETYSRRGACFHLSVLASPCLFHLPVVYSNLCVCCAAGILYVSRIPPHMVCPSVVRLRRKAAGARALGQKGRGCTARAATRPNTLTLTQLCCCTRRNRRSCGTCWASMGSSGACTWPLKARSHPCLSAPVSSHCAACQQARHSLALSTPSCPTPRWPCCSERHSVTSRVKSAAAYLSRVPLAPVLHDLGPGCW